MGCRRNPIPARAPLTLPLMQFPRTVALPGFNTSARAARNEFAMRRALERSAFRLPQPSTAVAASKHGRATAMSCGQARYSSAAAAPYQLSACPPCVRHRAGLACRVDLQARIRPPSNLVERRGRLAAIDRGVLCDRTLTNFRGEWVPLPGWSTEPALRAAGPKPASSSVAFPPAIGKPARMPAWRP